MTDLELFDLLFQEHRGVLYGYLLGRAGEVTAAEDLLQETYVRAWRHIHELQEMCGDRQRFWLLAVARNLAHDHHRRRTVRGRFEAPMPDELPDTAVSADPARVVQRREEAGVLDAAIRRLPEELRTVLVMQVVAGMNSCQIGAVLQRPAGTVRNLLWRARRQLTKDLAANGFGEQNDRGLRLHAAPAGPVVAGTGPKTG